MPDFFQSLWRERLDSPYGPVYYWIDKVMQYCRAWNKATGYPMAIIPGAAHNSNYDRPDAVNRLIDGFLERLRTEVPNAAL